MSDRLDPRPPKRRQDGRRRVGIRLGVTVLLAVAALVAGFSGRAAAPAQAVPGSSIIELLTKVRGIALHSAPEAAEIGDFGRAYRELDDAKNLAQQATRQRLSDAATTDLEGVSEINARVTEARLRVTSEETVVDPTFDRPRTSVQQWVQKKVLHKVHCIMIDNLANNAGAVPDEPTVLTDAYAIWNQEIANYRADEVWPGPADLLVRTVVKRPNGWLTALQELSSWDPQNFQQDLVMIKNIYCGASPDPGTAWDESSVVNPAFNSSPIF